MPVNMGPQRLPGKMFARRRLFFQLTLDRFYRHCLICTQPERAVKPMTPPTHTPAPPTERQIAAAHWIVANAVPRMPRMVREAAWETLNAARAAAPAAPGPEPRT